MKVNKLVEYSCCLIAILAMFAGCDFFGLGDDDSGKHATIEKPSGIIATGIDSGRIDLRWNAISSTDAIKYQVFRNGYLVTTVSGTEYTDTSDLISDTIYGYYLVAKSAKGAISAKSDTVRAKTLASNGGSDPYASYVTKYVSTAGDDSAGDGSQEHPWKTIFYGYSQLSPGQRILIRGGMYGPELNVPTVNAQYAQQCGWIGIPLEGSGTDDGNRIVIQNYPGEVPVLDQQYQGMGFGTNASPKYITIRGLEITRCNHWGIGQETKDNPTVGMIVEDCYIHGIRVNVGSNGGCVRPDRWNDSIIRNNYFRDIRLVNDQYNMNAVCVGPAYSPARLLVEHNYFADAYYGVYYKRPSGYFSGASKGSIIRKNVFDRVGIYYSVAGAPSTNVWEGEENSENVYVETEVTLKVYECTPQSGPWTFRNNVFHDSSLVLISPVHVGVLGNVFYHSSSATRRHATGLVDKSMTDYSYVVGVDQWDYNLYSSWGGHWVLEYDTSHAKTYASMATWQEGFNARYTLSVDGHSIETSDPGFVDVSNTDVMKRDYTLNTGSVALNSGEGGTSIGCDPDNSGTKPGPDWTM